ncbi:hypothetical protein QR680_012404 [Steinernema hermaphroditum]|uniref:Uncharacterized protein n=1 Tax=Steinernema hermaphroditum TaxID=289476 RepID=A0AA39I1Y5_9BILA|nr:hypothetical protein QR680_012404 [Steinernema hermaphroditum]
MPCNPCGCWHLKDGAMSVAIWSAVYGIASMVLFGWQMSVLSNCRHVTMAQSNLQCEYWCPCVGASTARTSALVEGNSLPSCKSGGASASRTAIFCFFQFGVFGWQMAAIKYEKDRAANTLLPDYNTYGRFEVNQYFESYFQTPQERFYIGLFVIQVICLIVSFFLLFASLALIWGVHTKSRFLIWPWFPCMIASIVMSMTYCIMWWTGDVRDYWLVLTILETIGAFINIYCFVVILMYYRYMNEQIEYFRKQLYPPRDEGHFFDSSKDTSGFQGGPPDVWNYSPEHRFAPHYDDYCRFPTYPQEPPPAKTPLPIVPHGGEDDWITHWVKDSQRIGLVETNSEPISPTRMEAPELIHARSVPSMYPEESHDRFCRHHHRSGSRRSGRRRSRSRHRSSSRHCHESRDFSASSISSDYSDSTRRSRRHKHRSRERDRYSEISGTEASEATTERSRRHRKHRHRHRGKKKGPRQVKSRSGRDRTLDSTTEGFEAQQGQGLSFPQNIIIPPSGGIMGPDGKLQPQTFGINQKITISYDDEQPPPLPPRIGRPTDTSTLQRLPQHPLSITSNV